MSPRTRQILDDALSLPADERVSIVEQLLSSLDQPDPAIDSIWAQEVDRRIEQFDAGKMEAIPAQEVFAEFDSE